MAPESIENPDAIVSAKLIVAESNDLVVNGNNMTEAIAKRGYTGLLIALILGGCGAGEVPEGEVAYFEVSEWSFILDGGELADVIDVVVRRDGGFWTLSSYPPHVTLISADGRIERQFGARGQGPGELRYPYFLLDDPEGVAVYDMAPRRIERFTEDGERLGGKSAPPSEGIVPNFLRETSFAEPYRIQRFGDGIIELHMDLRLEYQIRAANVELEPAELARLRAMLLDQIREGAARTLPRPRMRCDTEHRIWVARFGLRSGPRGIGAEWDVFSDGDHIAVVTFPDRFVPMLFAGSWIVGIWEDEWEVQHLVRVSNPMHRR